MARLTKAEKLKQQEQKMTMTRKRLVLIVIMTFIVLLFVAFSNYGIITRYGLSSDTTQLSGALMEQSRISDSLRTVIKRLETDTTEIERLARERYGYVREGEEVFVIKQDSADS